MALLGVAHGIIKAGRPSNPTAPIQVASVQTLHARPECLPEANIVISDECHHDKAKTRQALFGRFPSERLELVLGLTATPERGDKKPLGERSGGIYQHLVVGATVAELQNTLRPDGHPILVKMRVKGPGKPQKELFRAPIEGLLEFGRRPDGSLRPSMLFLASIEESIAADHAARFHGIRSAHVDGDTDDETRRVAFERLRSGDLDLLCNVQIATEGFDAPNLEVIGIARGCSAESTWIQMIMRGARSSPETGKRDAVLIDYRGSSDIHGFIEEDRKYSLEGKAIERTAERVRMRQCPRCGSVFPPRPTCPDCDYELPIQRERQKIKRAEAVDLSPDRATPMAVKRAYHDQLVAEMQAKGWKPAAVGMRFKARFGYWTPFPIPGYTRSKGAAA